MLKKHELANNSSCLNKADPDEPVFVLRAKDHLAAQTVRLWAAMAVGEHEPEKIDEARRLAETMDEWHGKQPKVPEPLVHAGYIEKNRRG